MREVQQNPEAEFFDAVKQEKIEKIDRELKKVGDTQEIGSTVATIPEYSTPTDSPVELKTEAQQEKAETQKLEESTNIEDSASKKGKKEKISKPNALIEKVRVLRALLETNVIGKENIELIPQGKNVIIATTHIDNWSVAIAINALGDIFKNITVAEESTHYNILQDPANYLGHFVGRGDSFRVDYDSGKMDRQGKFDPNNFEPMKISLENGKPLVIAAQYDPAYKNNKNELSEKTGNGAAYLAQITKDAIILPVAIDTKLDKPLRGQLDVFRVIGKALTGRRVNVYVIVGKPFVPDHIENIDRLGVILQKRKSGEPTSKEELQEFSSLSKQLKEKSGIIMKRLAELLPPEKRGVWNNKEK